jgi:hypothetical protein
LFLFFAGLLLTFFLILLATLIAHGCAPLLKD